MPPSARLEKIAHIAAQIKIILTFIELALQSSHQGARSVRGAGVETGTPASDALARRGGLWQVTINVSNGEQINGNEKV